MVLITIVNGVYKSTYNWGAPPCTQGWPIWIHPHLWHLSLRWTDTPVCDPHAEVRSDAIFTYYTIIQYNKYILMYIYIYMYNYIYSISRVYIYTYIYIYYTHYMYHAFHQGPKSKKRSWRPQRSPKASRPNTSGGISQVVRWMWDLQVIYWDLMGFHQEKWWFTGI